jgi:hypothetical protein
MDGGSPALGDDGYVEICEGLSVKTWGVSHGVCFEKHTHRGSGVGVLRSPPILPTNEPPRLRARTNSSLSSRRESRGPPTPTSEVNQTNSNDTVACVYDSSAYFIRDIATGSEVLIFGDIEPDSLSLSPRNRIVWEEAAPKIASGKLRGIFIECSYDDSQSNATLFGHLAPRFLIEEMQVLAAEVEDLSRDLDLGPRKRKRHSVTHSHSKSPKHQFSPREEEPESLSPHSHPHSPSKLYIERRISFSSENNGNDHAHGNGGGIPFRKKESLPLKGLKVVIIHMKDKLDDEPHVGERILAQLLEYEQVAQLGCEFLISHKGMSLYL